MEEIDYLNAVKQAGDEAELVRAYMAYMAFKDMPISDANLVEMREFAVAILPPELQDIARAVYERLQTLGLNAVVEARLAEGKKENAEIEKIKSFERLKYG